MKKILLLTLLLSNIAWAQVTELKQTFDQLKGPGHWGEAYLEADIFTPTDEHYLELGVILADKLSEVSGLLSLNTQSLSDLGKKQFKKKVLKSLTGDYPAFFCEFYEENEDFWEDHSECDKKVKKLVNAVLNDENIDEVYLVNADGDYYGDWSFALLIAFDYDKEEALVMDFDLAHEI